eukprot:350118-Hanusia_phi.AAC.2
MTSMIGLDNLNRYRTVGGHDRTRRDDDRIAAGRQRHGRRCGTGRAFHSVTQAHLAPAGPGPQVTGD